MEDRGDVPEVCGIAEIVAGETASNTPIALPTNFHGFHGSCQFVQLAACIDVFQMQSNILKRTDKQFRDLRLWHLRV